jgi:hypothetical protein|tara:strand:+ start:399 stop:920 length:522 start_codon:yes stop_codon:yes gene_type:complete
MITDKLNRWFTMLVNLSVLAGIVLVAVQIQQNTDITKAQMANEYYLLDAQLELTMMGESPAQSLEKAIYFPDELNQEDAVILDRYFNFGILQLQRIRKMIELGVADEELYQERVGYLRWHLGNEAGRRWSTQYVLGEPNELYRDIETVLSGSDFQINKQVLDAMLTNPEPERQ